MYHGISQPIRALTRWMSACGALEAIGERGVPGVRWATCATWSATIEQPTQALIRLVQHAVLGAGAPELDHGRQPRCRARVRLGRRS